MHELGEYYKKLGGMIRQKQQQQRGIEGKYRNALRKGVKQTVLKRWQQQNISNWKNTKKEIKRTKLTKQRKKEKERDEYMIKEKKKEKEVERHERRNKSWLFPTYDLLRWTRLICLRHA